MKYIKQFSIIITVSFLGEVLHALLPLPIPASIYGLLLMLAGLCCHIIPMDGVKETGKFLVEVWWSADVYSCSGRPDRVLGCRISPILWQLIVVTAVSTVLVMAASGHVTQFVIRHEKPSGKKD